MDMVGKDGGQESVAQRDSLAQTLSTWMMGMAKKIMNALFYKGSNLHYSETKLFTSIWLVRWI